MGYVRGMGALPQPFVRPGTKVLIRPRLTLVRGRGFGATGSTSASDCSSPNYWNGDIGVCCAPLGTPPGQDPCSILNNPAFIAAQANDVGPIGPNGVPLSSPNYGTASPNNLADLSGYPNNVQADVQECYENPGASFIDSVGMQVNCPTQSTLAAPGIPVSAFSYAQLASMLAGSITPPQYLAGNAPYAVGVAVNNDPGIAPATSGGGGGGVASGSYPVSVQISKTSFNVGDPWQITISGPPNSQVAVSGTQNGASVGTATPMGTIGSGGTLVLTGTMGAPQVGNWTESWTVGGQNAGSISFSVAAPSGSSGGGGSTGNPLAGGSSSNGSSGGSSPSTDPFAFLTNTVTIGGIAIPIWALGGGAIAALWLMGRK